MGDVVYVSESTIEQRDGLSRAAHLPVDEEPTIYGIHGGIAEHYGVPEDAFEAHAASIDHVVAAAAG